MISVVCPFYNERDNLKELYQRLEGSLGRIRESWEIIFVDDGSTDGGGDYLKSLIPAGAFVRVVALDRNYGLATALTAGLREAQGEILATLDADLQNPPEEIPRLLEMLERGFDIVAGIRSERKDPWIKKLSSRIANRIRRRVTGDPIEDPGCTLRVFRRGAFQAFYPYQNMHRFFLTFAEKQGLRIKQVPVAHAPRKRGRSKYGVRNRLFQGLWDLAAVSWMLSKKINYRLRDKPNE